MRDYVRNKSSRISERARAQRMYPLCLSLPNFDTILCVPVPICLYLYQ